MSSLSIPSDDEWRPYSLGDWAIGFYLDRCHRCGTSAYQGYVKKDVPASAGFWPWKVAYYEDVWLCPRCWVRGSLRHWGFRLARLGLPGVAPSGTVLLGEERDERGHLVRRVVGDA